MNASASLTLPLGTSTIRINVSFNKLKKGDYMRGEESTVNGKRTPIYDSTTGPTSLTHHFEPSL